MREQEAGTAAMVSMHQTLKEEMSQIASERHRLVGKERNLIDAERSLASVLEASGIEWEPPADMPMQELQSPPKPALPERPPEPARMAPPPPPPTPPKQREPEPEFEKLASSGTKVGKSEAIEKMNKALEVAKRARDTGQDVAEVRRILKQARTAFENANWEEAVRLSGQILDMLASSPTASR